MYPLMYLFPYSLPLPKQHALVLVYPLLFVPTKEEGLMLLQEPLEATDVALNPHRTLKELLDAHLIEDTAELCLV